MMQVTWIVTTNQSALFQSRVVTLVWNLLMTSTLTFHAFIVRNTDKNKIAIGVSRSVCGQYVLTFGRSFVRSEPPPLCLLNKWFLVPFWTAKEPICDIWFIEEDWKPRRWSIRCLRWMDAVIGVTKLTKQAVFFLDQFTKKLIGPQ